MDERKRLTIIVSMMIAVYALSIVMGLLALARAG
jgi:hypothetical protein